MTYTNCDIKTIKRGRNKITEFPIYSLSLTVIIICSERDVALV